MILLVAQLILQNCPTFFMTIWRPLKTAPPGVAGAAGASLRHCCVDGSKPVKEGLSLGVGVDHHSLRLVLGADTLSPTEVGALSVAVDLI